MAVDSHPQPGVLPTAASVLAVCAHPDDESFGLGALLDRFVAGGTDVAVLCFTQGEASSLGLSERALAEVRAAELTRAASVLGIGHVELLDHPDGGLSGQPLEDLAAEVARTAAEVQADLLVVFDEGGVTGHPDHEQATAAALAGAPTLPVLAWTLPQPVADALNVEFSAAFVGRGEAETDLVVSVDRSAQQRAIACHPSQANDNPVLARRLEALGDREWLRWLRRPSADGDRHRAVADQWDRRYASAPHLFRSEPDESLVAWASPLPPGRAVDLGAGEGRNSLWLAARGWDVVAIDASRVALDRLAAAATEAGLAIRTVVGDLVAFLDGARSRGELFDLAILSYIHPDPSERPGLLRAAADGLRDGGHLFVVAHDRSSFGVAGPPDPDRLYTEDDLRGIPGLDTLRLEQRRGASDVDEPGTDVLLWAARRRTPTA